MLHNQKHSSNLWPHITYVWWWHHTCSGYFISVFFLSCIIILIDFNQDLIEYNNDFFYSILVMLVVGIFFDEHVVFILLFMRNFVRYFICQICSLCCLSYLDMEMLQVLILMHIFIYYVLFNYIYDEFYLFAFVILICVNHNWIYMFFYCSGS